MKLLSPEVHRHALADEEKRAKANLQKILDAIDEGTKHLNHLREGTTEEESALIEKRKRAFKEHEEFLRAIDEEKSSLIQEVNTLEERRREALHPIEDRTQELDIREQSLIQKKEELRVRAENLDTREQELEDKATRYEEKFDELVDREVTLKKSEHSLALLSRDLEEHVAQSNEAFLQRSESLKNKAELLIARERELEVIAETQRIEREVIAKERSELLTEKKFIRSQQDALAQAYQEAKEKGIIRS